MHVVGSDGLNVQLLGELQKERQYAPLFFQSVVLYLNIKIVAENILQFQRGLFRPLVISFQEKLGDPARKTGGKTDEPFAVLAESLIIQPRLIIKSVDISDRIHFYEVFVPRLVLGEQDQVFEIPRTVFDPQVLRHIHLAADDRLNIVFFAQFGKIQRRVHIAVIGDRKRLHIVFYTMVYEVVHLARPVEQTVFRMQM